MAEPEYEPSVVPPTERSGGTIPDEAEAREKGWGGEVADGVVPAELGGSDAPREMLDDDPELGSGVLGRTTGSDEPAAEGIDPNKGDNADATSDGGPDLPPGQEEPAQSAAPAASRDPERGDGVN